MQVPPTPELKIFMQAERFRRARHALDKTADVEIKVGWLGVPLVTISAFAIELFLKCLLLIEGGKLTKVHDLDYLFGLLPEHVRKEIEALWDARPQPDEVQWAFIESQNKIKVPRDLRGQIRESKDAFVRIRYGFENASEIRFYIDQLADILWSVIVKRRPIWARLKPGTHQAHLT